MLSHVAAFGASLGGALTLAWIAGLAGLTDFVPRMKPDGVLGEVWTGAWAGVLLYVVFSLTQIYIRPVFVRWACRLPNAEEETTLLTVRTVLAGGGILKRMSAFEIKGIIAQEVAHVMRKDVLLRLLPASALGSVGFMIVYLQHARPLFG